MSNAPGRMSGQDPLVPRPSGTWDPAAARARALALLKRKSIIIPAALLLIVGFAWGWNPPVDTVHYFSASSDYRASRESGCTNSGKGCHGQEASYKDFNVYHPNATCTTCHEYQGVGCIPCHKPKAHECTDCHDGSMEGVADTTRLSDPYPRGHYRESTHTAMGTDMKRVVRAAEGGEAGATCKDCHSRDLRKAHLGVPVVKGSTYGKDISCIECHNDKRSAGLAQVESNWKGRRCEDCHTKGSSTPIHPVTVASEVEGVSRLACGSTGSGCHAVNELHALHPDRPVDCAGAGVGGGPGCHVLGLESHEPTATIPCGGGAREACHRLYVNDRYSHAKDRSLHSPSTLVPAADTSYFKTPCGGCHRMEPNGTSLTDEHALPTSARTKIPGDNCRNCHNALASAYTIADDWSERNTFQACDACHGTEGLPAAHSADIERMHTPARASTGCGSSGMGCHPTSDLSEVGAPTPTANLHSTCLRCHDWRKRDGNLAYDTAAKTCGPGRDCHAVRGAYEPTSAIHAGNGGLADGFDGAHHTAGSVQAAATWNDPAAKTGTRCDACHSMVLGVEHGRPTSSIATGAGTLCTRCHNDSLSAAWVVKTSWGWKDTNGACATCHAGVGVEAVHSKIASAHAPVELAPSGVPTPGSCVRSGCHYNPDLRWIHRASGGCMTVGCHQATGAPDFGTLLSCGGPSATVACHAGYSETQHFVSHDAGRSGTIGSVTYTAGANVGCFGCHVRDLASEHSTELVQGSMEGGGVTSCAVCHDEPGDPGRGAYAKDAAVAGAISAGDQRCASCHATGTAADGATAVASAHKDVSTDATLPAGKVWADPFGEWRASLDAVTGGGHNGPSAAAVGASADKAFPLESFSVRGTLYTWALPPNSGDTAWLRTDVYPGATTTEAISAIAVGCDDCHTFAGVPAGPQGAAVKVGIDPAYSQTAYANPSPLSSQFEATGTDRVVCFKCHSIAVGSVAGTTSPGGNPVHAKHVSHPGYPWYNPQLYGEKCIDCHVRIPHAWKRPRLLIRTVVAADGAAPDAPPYVRQGHWGLAGVLLKSVNSPADITPDSCATGGCHLPHDATTHPMPAETPGAEFWP